MAKASKLYSYINDYQIAKREDGIWFYRKWKRIESGLRGFLTWTKWESIGRLTKVERDISPTLARFDGYEDVMIKRIYAEFDNKYIFQIKPDHKIYNNNLRLPNT